MNLAYSVAQAYRDLIDQAERRIRTILAEATHAPAPSWMYEWIRDLDDIRARELAEPIREVESVRLIHSSARARITSMSVTTAEHKRQHT